MSIRLDLPPRGVLKPNDGDDPLPYYYHPWIGWLYRHRLQMAVPSSEFWRSAWGVASSSRR